MSSINPNFVTFQFNPTTYDGKTFDRIVYIPSNVYCQWKNGPTEVYSVTKNSLNECLNTVSGALTGFNKIYTQVGGNLEEIPLTEIQIQEVEELSVLYQEFLWTALLPIAALIFALSLTLKILSGIFAI